MSFSPHSPITTEQRLPLPLNGTVYTTVRPVATEKPLPNIGNTMAGELGSAWADSRVIGVNKIPSKGDQGKQLSITHARIPSITAQLASNWEYSTADIAGTRYPSVSRTFVLLAEDVAHDAPAAGSAMPFVAADIFDGKGYILVDRQIVRSGMELEPTFRVERRNYVKRATLTDNGYNEALGVNLSRTTTLYYRGETVSGVAIETLVADDKNAYWGTQVNLKISRSGEQLSDNWFAVIEQQITLKRGTNGALTDDWPIGQVKSKGRNILTPQKFRIGTEVVETTTPLDLSATNVDNLPAPATPTGDEVEVRVTKINDYRYEKKITTETVNANTNPLVGEEYGNIVTYSTSEELVDEGDLADTGLEIVNSKVEPLGDGKAIKTTTEVKGGTWPDPLSKEVTNEGPGLPPQRYRKDVTLTKTSKKIAASAIPASPVLSGNEIAKQYVKETPDRAEEIVTTQVLNLNVSNVDTAVDRKPFVSITSTMSPGNAPVLPATGNGNARLVYENGTNLIYENTSEVAEAVPGPAGTEKDQQVFVTKNIAKRYSTENTVSTATGVSRVVFNDGKIQVYEVDEVTSTGKYGAAGTEERTQTFVKLITDKFYNPTGTVTGNGSSRKIYDDGQTVVYEESRERAEAVPGTAGTEKDARVGYTLTTEKEYSTSNTVTKNLGSSRVAFNDGNIQVYEVSNVTASAKPIDFVGGKIASPLFNETTTTRYSTSPEGEGIYNSRVDFTDGDLVIYEVNSTTVEPLAPRTYSTVINARVPAVLQKIEFKKWDRRDGGSRTAVNVFIEEGYVGSFPGRITEFFTKDPNAAEGFEAQQMRPKSISYSGHNFSISIPPTLHPAVYFEETTGTEDPVWEYEFYRLDVPATEPTSVPTGFVPYALDVQPFKDGYIIRKIEIKYK